jgi:hypothetical protein
MKLRASANAGQIQPEAVADLQVRSENDRSVAVLPHRLEIKAGETLSVEWVW